MDAELRKVLKKLVLGVRHLLEGYYDNFGVWHAGDLEQRLNQLGVWRDRPAIPLEELPQLSEVDNKARRTVNAYIKYREDTGVNRSEAVEEFIRESAYSWFNRLFALRCMEARGIIDEVIHQKEIYGGRSLQHNRLAIRQPELCVGEDDGLYAVFIQEFDRMSHELPMIFNPESPAVTLRMSVSIVKRLVAMLSGLEPVNGEYVSDETFIASDAFGWAYQDWNVEEKDRVRERVKTEKVKIEGKDIIPVTCIYTEPYMVNFLVQNSLGALWDSFYPESTLYKKWDYYVRATDRSPVKRKPIREITFLDPACGSGHFLLEAFELFYDMYKEEGELNEPRNICASILENNLYGVDIDERAVQISVAILWMKAKERAPELDTSELSGFLKHMVATNIRLPKGRDHLEEYLRKHRDDEPLRPALESIFVALENVNEIGSLLKIKGPLEQAFEKLQTDHGIQTTLWANGFTSVDSWQENVIAQLQDHFNEEAISSELSNAFFGQSMNKGLKVIDLLSTKYDVVATNPPYMGLNNMGKTLKKYVETNYNVGKRDLYASFLLNCLSVINNNGFLGIVTQRGWLTQKHYTKLRDYILNKYQIDVIINLGPRAFDEIKGENVSVALSVYQNTSFQRKLMIGDYIGYKTKEQKKYALQHKENLLEINKDALLRLDNYQILSGVPARLIDLLGKSKKLREQAEVEAGLWTGDDTRFTRWFWEAPNIAFWMPLGKGGAYRRWWGLLQHKVRWQNNGAVIKDLVCKKFPYLKGKYEWVVKNEHSYFQAGTAYSFSAGASLGVRVWPSGAIFSELAPFIVTPKGYEAIFAGLLSTRVYTLLLRAIADKLRFRADYVNELPAIPDELLRSKVLLDCANYCLTVAKKRSNSDILEMDFNPNSLIHYNFLASTALESIRLSIENIFEKKIMKSFNLGKNDVDFITKIMGKNAGDYPLLRDYDKIPCISDDHIISYEIRDLLVHNNKINGYASLKNKLKMYLTSKSIHKIKKGKNQIIDSDTNWEIIPLPPELFIEEISHLLRIHPFSVYWLLEEGIKQEGWRYNAGERLILTDKFTLMILHLLGHRWPRQISAGEPFLKDADLDGIIPLTRCIDEATLFDRLREQINEDIPNDRLMVVPEFEALIGKSLQEWLLFDFFKHHTKQFKKRPIVWLIQSTPQRKTRKINPAFSCLIYFHKLDGDTLHKIQSQYLQPLRTSYEVELRTLDAIGILSSEQIARKASLEMIIDELEEFEAKLQDVINQGFDSKELKGLIADQPIDMWCSIDGVEPPPDSHEGLYLQERAYIPDVNDGVRVNIAPLQKAGLLASDVLAKKDLERAISDRAKWRADERRWCREGKLPKLGWWKEHGS